MRDSGFFLKDTWPPLPSFHCLQLSDATVSLPWPSWGLWILHTASFCWVCCALAGSSVGQWLSGWLKPATFFGICLVHGKYASMSSSSPAKPGSLKPSHAAFCFYSAIRRSSRQPPAFGFLQVRVLSPGPARFKGPRSSSPKNSKSRFLSVTPQIVALHHNEWTMNRSHQTPSSTREHPPPFLSVPWAPCMTGGSS